MGGFTELSQKRGSQGNETENLIRDEKPGSLERNEKGISSLRFAEEHRCCQSSDTVPGHPKELWASLGEGQGQHYNCSIHWEAPATSNRIPGCSQQHQCRNVLSPVIKPPWRGALEPVE